MPGFKNAHTHSGMTFLRSYADDLPLNEWLNEQVFPMEAKLTEEDIYHLSKLAIMEYLTGMTFLRSYADDLPLNEWLNEQVFPMEAKLTEEDIYHLSKLAIMEYLTSGITANFDMYLVPDAIAEASKDCGCRTVIAGALNDCTQSPKQLSDWYEKYNHDHELISFQLGFHAEYTTSEKLLKEVALLAQNYQAPVYTHNSETIREVEECKGRTGIGFHAEYTTSEKLLKEVALLAQNYQAPVYTHNSETIREVEECKGRTGTTPTAYLDSLGMFEYSNTEAEDITGYI